MTKSVSEYISEYIGDFATDPRSKVCLGVIFVRSTRFRTLSACPLRSHRVRSFALRRVDAVCRYCCKSPKFPGANFLAVKKSDRRPPIDVAPITLPRSPASLSSRNEVPHIFTRKSCVQPKEILITSAKRLLQQNLPRAVIWLGIMRWRANQSGFTLPLRIEWTKLPDGGPACTYTHAM